MFLVKMLYELVQELKKLEGDTLMLITRFVIRAGKSPSPNQYIKTHLQRILDEDDRPAPQSSPRQVNYPYREVKKP